LENLEIGNEYAQLLEQGFFLVDDRRGKLSTTNKILNILQGNYAFYQHWHKNSALEIQKRQRKDPIFQ
jgi:hypothetical protein